MKRTIGDLPINIAAVAALLAIGAALASCDRIGAPTQQTATVTESTDQITDSPAETADAIPSPNAQVTDSSMTQESQGADEGSIRGRVMSKSDVSTIPDSPLQALVLVVPTASFHSLLEEVGFKQDDGGGFGKLGFGLAESIFEKYAVASTITNQNGDFELQVPLGSVLLCVANIDLPTRSAMFPAYVQGCIEVSAAKGRQTILDVFLQFGRVTSR